MSMIVIESTILSSRTITREQLFFTLLSLSAKPSAGVVLHLDLSALGIAAGTTGHYTVKGIAQGTGWTSGRLTEDGALAIGNIGQCDTRATARAYVK